jgi:uncharacterized membrane protein HdeD (DUF308 family)
MQTQEPIRTTIFENTQPSFAPTATLVPWREPMLRGVLAILVGTTLIVFPVSAILVLTIAFGAFVLIDGVLAVVHATRKPQPEAKGWWWAMLGRGVLGIVVGAIAILFPSLAAAALGTLIAIWAIIAGCLEVGAGLRTHYHGGRETMIVALGVLTIVLGIVLLFAPLLALVAQVYVFAAYAIIAGIGLIAFANRLRLKKNRGTVLPV